MSPLVVEQELERERERKLSGCLCPFPQVQCLYAPSRLSVPSIVAWRTNKNRQTRPPSSAGSRPPLPNFSGYVEVDTHYIFHPSTIWPDPVYGAKAEKTLRNADFAMKQTNICRLSGDIKKTISLKHNRNDWNKWTVKLRSKVPTFWR